MQNGHTPAGLRVPAGSPVHGELLTVGKTTSYSAGAAVATSTVYRAASGALVFDAATNQWAWGLEWAGQTTGGNLRIQLSRLRLRRLSDRLGITSAVYRRAGRRLGDARGRAAHLQPAGCHGRPAGDASGKPGARRPLTYTRQRSIRTTVTVEPSSMPSRDVGSNDVDLTWQRRLAQLTPKSCSTSPCFPPLT